MIRIIEKKKFDPIAYLEDVNKFFTAVFGSLYRIHNSKPSWKMFEINLNNLFESDPSKEFDKAAQAYKNAIDKAIKDFSSRLTRCLIQLSTKLNEGKKDSEELVVEEEKKVVKKINKEVESVSKFKDILLASAETFKDETNKYIDDLNRTLQELPKNPKNGKIDLVDKIK